MLWHSNPRPDTEPTPDRQLTVVPSISSRKISRAIVVSAIVADADNAATKRFLEFFAVTIPTKSTRTGTLHAAGRLFARCEHHRLGALDEIEPLHVAVYIEALGKDFENPNEIPTHQNLEAYFHSYMEAPGIGDAAKALLFRSAAARTVKLADNPMNRADDWRMIQRRAADLGTRIRIGCHTFNALGSLPASNQMAC